LLAVEWAFTNTSACSVFPDVVVGEVSIDDGVPSPEVGVGVNMVNICGLYAMFIIRYFAIVCY
jgi:hypothetical protein